MPRNTLTEYDRMMILHTGETDAQRERRLTRQMGRPLLAPLLAGLSVLLDRAARRCRAASKALGARRAA